MESIYYVISWLCHRTCAHCYEDRFRPYYGDDLIRVINEARESFPKVIANLPPRMTFFDATDPNPDGTFPEKPGRIGISGGEVLLKQVRECVLYPALDLLHEKYRNNGGVELAVQTTGDLVTDKIIDELLERHVQRITVSGIDDYHDGFAGAETQARIMDKLTRMFESHGMVHRQFDLVTGRAPVIEAGDERPGFSFFGAQPGSWIGPLWPRGRAHLNEISTAKITDNFCNRPAGGVNFLQHRQKGSKVAIEPNGNVYPCCIKTKAPLGNLTEEPLEDILKRYIGNPVFEAISMGRPERMGISKGWSVEKFIEKSTTTLPSGRVYQNLCVGCDKFFEEELMSKAPLVNIQAVPG